MSDYSSASHSSKPLTDSTVPYPPPPYWLIFSRGCPSVCLCLCHLFTASNWIAAGQMSWSLPAWSAGGTVTIVLWQSEASLMRIAQHLDCMWFLSPWGWLGVKGVLMLSKQEEGNLQTPSLFRMFYIIDYSRIFWVTVFFSSLDEGLLCQSRRREICRLPLFLHLLHCRFSF